MKQKQLLERAEAESKVEEKRLLSMSPSKGRRSLIQGMRDSLG